MKTIKTIWKRFLLWIGAAAMLLSVGCGKREATEESTMQLDMVQMLETAAQPTDDVIVPEGTGAATEQMRQRLGAPEHVNDSFQSKDGYQTVQIDADVSIPNATKLSIVEVSRSPLTQDRADRVVKALVKGQLLAYDTILKRCIGRTEVQYWMDALDKLLVDQGAAADSAWRAEMQAEREYWASVLANATEDTAPITSRLTHPAWWGTADGSNGYRMDKDDSLRLLGVAESEAGYETLHVWQGIDQGCILCYVREPNEWVSPGAQVGDYMNEKELAFVEKNEADNPYGRIRASDIPSIPAIQTTQAQALEIGNELMQVLGIDHVSCVAADKCWGGSFDADASGVRGIMLAAYGVTNPFRCVWRLRYTRTFNGMENTYDDNQCMPVVDPDDDKEVLPSADYESIEVYIDDTGIVGFRWASPQDIGNVVVEDSAVLPFDEILRVFSGTFLSTNTWSDVALDAQRCYEIGEIRFGYTRIREQSVYDKGLLVPAWDFYGTRIYEPGNDAGEIPCLPDRSIFTINAIDGTIIDRAQGY